MLAIPGGITRDEVRVDRRAARALLRASNSTCDILPVASEPTVEVLDTCDWKLPGAFISAAPGDPGVGGIAATAPGVVAAGTILRFDSPTAG